MTSSAAPDNAGLHRDRQGRRECAASRSVPAKAACPGCFGSAASSRTCGAPRPLALDAWAAERQSRLRPVRLFRPWRIRRRFRRRHDRALAGGERRGVRAVLRWPPGGDRLIDGRMDGVVAGARTGQAPGAPAIAGGAGADRAGAGFYRGADVEGVFAAKSGSEIETKGVWLRPSEYGDPYPITRELIEEGRNHLLLGGAIEVGCPVRILQGAQDPDVPWQHAFALAHRLPAEDVVLTDDPGRRSSPVAAAGHRADDGGGGGDGLTGIRHAERRALSCHSARTVIVHLGCRGPRRQRLESSHAPAIATAPTPQRREPAGLRRPADARPPPPERGRSNCRSRSAHCGRSGRGRCA